MFRFEQNVLIKILKVFLVFLKQASQSQREVKKAFAHCHTFHSSLAHVPRHSPPPSVCLLFVLGVLVLAALGVFLAA